MAKFFLALAALVAAGAVEAQDFSPLQNPGTGKCIVTGAYNADLENYSIKAGSCTALTTVKFRHLGNGKALKTDKGFCLGTAKPSNKAGTKLILDECLAGAVGQKWTKVGNKQWRNGYLQCIETQGGSIVQKPCKTLSVDNTVSKQQWVFYKRPSPPVPPQEINCFDWGKRYACPANWSPLAKPQAMTCVGATDKTCYSVCCKQDPQFQLCGTWSVKNGGPVNSCGIGYTYAAGDRDMCAANGANCRARCCVQDPPMTCPSQVTCDPGYSVINQPCGTRPGQPCNQNFCCQLNTITCRRWNNCPPGSKLTADAGNTDCALVNSPLAPRCNQALCCEPFTPPPTSIYCKDYFLNGNTCKPDYKEISDADVIKCDPTLDNDCDSMCCYTTTVTCKTYFEDPDNVCEPDFEPISDAEQIKCDTTIDGDCNDMCCQSSIPLPANV